MTSPYSRRPPSTAYRLSKFIRRNRALVTSIAAVIVTLSVGLTLAMAGFLSAQNRLVEVMEEHANNEVLIKLLGNLYDFPFGTHMVGQQQTMRRDS